MTAAAFDIEQQVDKDVQIGSVGLSDGTAAVAIPSAPSTAGSTAGTGATTTGNTPVLANDTACDDRPSSLVDIPTAPSPKAVVVAAATTRTATMHATLITTTTTTTTTTKAAATTKVTADCGSDLSNSSSSSNNNNSNNNINKSLDYAALLRSGFKPFDETVVGQEYLAGRLAARLAAESAAAEAAAAAHARRQRADDEVQEAEAEVGGGLLD